MLETCHRTLIAVLCATAVTGCSGLQTQSGSEQIWKYGSFCGKDHPTIDPRLTPSAQITQLQGIRPIDDVDRTCQLHDICYTAARGPTAICDRVLTYNLHSIQRDIPKRTEDYSGFVKDSSGHILDGCTKLIEEVGHFAIAASGWNSDDLFEKVTTGIVATFAAVVNTPAMLMGGAFSSQGGQLAVGKNGTRCIAKREPKFIAPVSLEEINSLRGCYDIQREFSKCKRVPVRGRSAPSI